LLLDNTVLTDRRLIALLIRTEERALYEDTVQLVDSLVVKLQTDGESYLPPDAIE